MELQVSSDIFLINFRRLSNEMAYTRIDNKTGIVALQESP